MTITDAVPLTSGAATTPVVFAVYGTPAGQGRISFRGKGRGAYHSNDAKLKPWRKAIINAAQAATGRHTYIDWQKTCAKCQVPEAEHALFVGVPMAVSVTITVEKPKSAPKRRRSWPITRYSTDIDHHARACLDALSQSGLLHDDSMVVELTARKVYPHEHLSALDQPGALIRIWRINDDHTT